MLLIKRPDLASSTASHFKNNAPDMRKVLTQDDVMGAKTKITLKQIQIDLDAHAFPEHPKVAPINHHTSAWLSFGRDPGHGGNGLYNTKK